MLNKHKAVRGKISVALRSKPIKNYAPQVTLCKPGLTLQNSTFCPHSCIYVFCVDLRTNSDYFPIQHWL